MQVGDDGVAQRHRFAALGSGSMDAIAILEAARSGRKGLHALHYWKLVNKNNVSGSHSVSPPNEQATTLFDSESFPSHESTSFMEDITVEEGVEVVRQAAQAGILNDLGSGSDIDICVITRDDVRLWREEAKSHSDSESVSRADITFDQLATKGAGVSDGLGSLLSPSDAAETEFMSIDALQVESDNLDSDETIPVKIRQL